MPWRPSWLRARRCRCNAIDALDVVALVSADQRDRPGGPSPDDPIDAWGRDELTELLAYPDPTSRVSQILAAAAAPADAGPQPGEGAAIAAFRAAFSTSGADAPHGLAARLSRRSAAAVLAGGLVLCGSATAAAAGALPDAAQQIAQKALASVGVHVPGPTSKPGQPARPGQNNPVPAIAPQPTTGPQDTSPTSHGSEVSDLAHSTTSTGVDKGAVVSGTASDGKSQAGQHGKAGATPTPRSSGHPNSHKPTPKPQSTPTAKPLPTQPANPKPTPPKPKAGA